MTKATKTYRGFRICKNDEGYYDIMMGQELYSEAGCIDDAVYYIDEMYNEIREEF